MTQDLFHGEHYFMIGSTKGYGVSMSGLFFVRFDSSLYYDTTRIVDLPTAISSESNSQNVLLYPNPTQDILNIKFTKNIGKSELRIFDINGREVMYRLIIEGSEIKIDIQSLSDGIYQILIVSGQNLFRSQFIKQSSF